MLWCYDDAICNDLKQSFRSPDTMSPVVKVLDADGILDLIAQIQDDSISFPIIVLTRQSDTAVDSSRTNFTRMKKGVPSVIDENNYIYDEKAIPIELGYDITVLATNTADMDELVKELMFKYAQMFFIKFQVPYESKRMIQFGVSIDSDTTIRRTSGVFDYLEGGVLYQSILSLKCQGAVLLSYTPRRMPMFSEQVEILNEPNNVKERNN